MLRVSNLNSISVGSKVGSLDNASHKASGGNVKIEDRRLEWKTVGRTDARNPNYTPQGGNKKVRTYTEITLCPFNYPQVSKQLANYAP